MKMETVLVTGAAGFIGARTSALLLERGVRVIGVDNMNDYYDPRVKEYRLSLMQQADNFDFYRVDIENFDELEPLFEKYKIDGVINLAARAGVRWSLVDPFVYVRTNTLGTTNLLELMHQHGVQKFVLASTSSLYAGQKMPFVETLPVNEPISPYAASKKGAEAMAYTYHYLHGIDVTILRYFTVYGPAGRPDMSVYRFIRWIEDGETMEVFGDGTQKRDFSYVDDIALGTVAAANTATGYEIINLGGNKPYELNQAISLIEQNLKSTAKIERKPFHKADMMGTWANVEKAEAILGWKAQVSFEEGIRRTVDWHRENRDWLKKIPLP